MYYKTIKIIMAYFFRLVGIAIILLLCYALLFGGRPISSILLPSFSVIMISFFFFWLADKTINEKEDK